MKYVIVPLLTVILVAIGKETYSVVHRATQSAPEKPVAKAAPEPSSIEGVYFVEGFEGDKPYQGVCMVQKPHDLYLFQWLSSGRHVIGCGVRIGDTVSVGWTMSGANGDTQGVTVYRIEDGKLVGRWGSFPGNRQANRETLRLLAKIEKKEE